jgi:Na+-transporting methylmalonyl-CoA/oxaloacetate decarboxylase gamma subunit
MFVYTLGDIVGVVFLVLGLLFIAAWAIRDAWVQWRCKHERYYETMSCDAICNHCRKNLGFIGNLRDKNNGSKS